MKLLWYPCLILKNKYLDDPHWYKTIYLSKYKQQQPDIGYVPFNESRAPRTKRQVLTVGRMETEQMNGLKNKCHGNLKCILMDASATELYTTLCNEFNQNSTQKYLRDKQIWCKQTNSNIMQYLFVCPIPFNPMSKTMTQHTQRLVQETDYDGTALVGIHKQFEDLILSCHSAYVVDEKLDKERTVHADSFDALRMNLQYYNFGDK